jgi:hypothetical protein
MRRQERYEPLIKGLAEQGAEYKLWDAVRRRESIVRSINESHKNIVRAAKEQGLPEVCIGEDDLMFTAAGAWQYFLEKKPPPNEYDLYLGGTYIKPFEPLFVQGFQLYFVSAKFYDRFLSVPDLEHIDTAMNDIEDRQYVLCRPIVALQRAGISANHGAFVDYNKYLSQEDLYVG